MPDHRKPSLILPVAGALLLAGYVGAYYWTVWPVRLSTRVVLVFREAASSEPAWERYGFRRAFFAPIHWLDRRIRPHVWQSR